MAVNQHSALRQPTNHPRTGRGARHEQTEGRVKKNDRERSRRDWERRCLERMSYLFKVGRPQETWTRMDILGFGEMASLIGEFG